MKDTFWVEESSGKPFGCNKRKRRAGKRTLEFLGWGSKPLIEFLELIGQDTKEKHSQHAVASFINKYIKENGLASAEKKKKVLCDDILFALFGKKSILRTKVYEMLEEHFAENHDDSDDELLDSSDDEDYREKSSLGLKNNPTTLMKKVPKIPKSCFAAIIPENIKLIYLKKSLIQELLKFPESFEFKVIGSFVRMKSDPNDIFQKNPFQLQQVTGDWLYMIYISLFKILLMMLDYISTFVIFVTNRFLISIWAYPYPLNKIRNDEYEKYERK